MPRLASSLPRSRPESGGSAHDQSSSLKALPPEASLGVGGVSLGSSGASPTGAAEVATGIVGNSAHWTVSNKAERPPPVRKSVSLKLAKGAVGGTLGSPGSSVLSSSAGPTSSSRIASSPHKILRASSTELVLGEGGEAGADGVGERLRRSEQQSSFSRGSGSAPPRQDVLPSSTSSSSSRAPKGNSRPPPADGRPLSSNDERPLSSTAPAAVDLGAGRPPPAPTRKVPSKTAQPRAGSLVDEDDDFDDKGRVFAPLNQAPPTPLPRSKRAVAAGGCGLNALLAASLRSPMGAASPQRMLRQQRGAAAESEDFSAEASDPQIPAHLLPRPLSAASYEQLLADAEEPEPPAAPRIAWSDGQGAQQGEEFETDFDSMTELAAQLRRDLLARRVTDEWEVEADGEAAEEAPSVAERRMKFDTEDGRKAGEELDKSLAESSERARNTRAELDDYLANLRSRTFQLSDDQSAAPTSDANEEAERLITLPADFEDIVDINASLKRNFDEASMKRKRPSVNMPDGSFPEGNSASASSTAGVRAPAGVKSKAVKESKSQDSAPLEGFKLPSFLEKYFFEEKAVQEIPHLALENSTTAEEGQRDEAKSEAQSEIDRLANQIQRLDGLLAKREAVGEARLKAGKVNVDTYKEKLRRDSEMSEQEKLVKLKRLKDRGMMKNSVPSCASGRASVSRATPATSLSVASTSVPGSVRGASAVVRKDAGGGSMLVKVVAEDCSSPTGAAPALMDWGSWTTEATTAATAMDSVDSDRPGTAFSDGADIDTETFNLTSMTPGLAKGTPQTDKQPTQKLVSLDEDAELALSIPDPPAASAGADLTSLVDADEEPLAIPDDPYAGGVESVLALQRIDEELQRIVPEREWDAKSIASFPVLCSAEKAESAAGGGESSAPSMSENGIGGKSKVRSIWSHATGSGESTAPRDPNLLEQFEKRESTAALAKLEGRLVNLKHAREVNADQRLEDGAAAPSQEDLQKLLMQALQDCQPPDAASKVLALTGGPGIAKALQDAAREDSFDKENTALVPLLPDRPCSATLSENAKLQEAKRILSRLSAVDEDAPNVFSNPGSDEEDSNAFGMDGGWNAAMGEAAFSIEQLGSDLTSLEEKALAESAISKQRPPPTAAESELAPLAQRLESLREEAAALINRDVAIEGLRLPPAEEPDQSDIGHDEDDMSFLGQLPGDYDGPNCLDEGFIATSTSAVPMSAGYPAEAPARPADPDGPSLDLMRALDIQLPSGDAQWDDDELERISRAMNEHYGDKVPLGAAASLPRERDLDYTSMA